jgi:hypothetical protein
LVVETDAGGEKEGRWNKKRTKRDRLLKTEREWKNRWGEEGIDRRKALTKKGKREGRQEGLDRKRKKKIEGFRKRRNR